MAETLCSQCRGLDFDLGSGARSCTLWLGVHMLQQSIWDVVTGDTACHNEDQRYCMPQLRPGSVQFSSVTQSCWTLWPHEPEHGRPPCPSPTPGVHSNSCPSSRWCHPAISSSVVPFSSCPQSFPASGSFQMSQLFSSEGNYPNIKTYIKNPEWTLYSGVKRLKTFPLRLGIGKDVCFEDPCS